MSSTNTGGPAFPFLSYNTGDNLWYQQEGMTLRDYFAAKAMRALGGPATSSSYPDRMNESIIAGYASECYAMADAMLEARDE